MSSLPPPPDSYFEGGGPKSSVAPGDTGRELLHEVKNLHQAVVLLPPAVKNLRRRQRMLWYAIIISVLSLLVTLGYTRYLAVEQTRDRLQADHASCQRDFRRGEIEIDILKSALLARQNDPRAKVFYEPRIKALEKLQEDCGRNFPQEGTDGWPSFWRA